MGIVKPGVGLAALAAVGGAMLAPASPLVTDPVQTSAVDYGRYRVFHAGLDTGCEIGPEAVEGQRRVRLVVGETCAEEALSGLRYWSDREDGTVELSDAAGMVALRFASGDGAAYEAFGSGAPLIMLVDSGR